MHDGVTIEEARYLHQEDARHAADEETPHEEALQWCRHLVGRYGDADELSSLEVVEAGPCMDGRRHNPHDANVRYQIGKFAVCRDHAIRRLHARRQLERATMPAANPIADEHPPDDLHAWAGWAATNGYTERALRAALRLWKTDDDQVVELVDAHADTRRAIHEREQADELRLQQLDTLDDQRCDACRTRGTVYLAGDDALCRPCTLAAIHVAKTEVA